MPSLTNRSLSLSLSALFTTAFMAAGTGTGQADPATWQSSSRSVPALGFVVDMNNRSEVLSFHQTVFKASEGSESRIGWTSTYGGCNEGTTNLEFRADVQRRVNYYRALCQLPAGITFDAEPIYNVPPTVGPQLPSTTPKYSAAQSAAYNNAISFIFGTPLSHTPARPDVWCDTSFDKIWNGCYNCNLTIGFFGAGAIDSYIADDDLVDKVSDNTFVGHRRWILFSGARDMSTGDVPPGTYISVDPDGTRTPFSVSPANALYINSSYLATQIIPQQIVTWPPAGFVPVGLKPQRWSISFPKAVFSPATSAITLTGPDGKTIPVKILSYKDVEHGDNTLVFQPDQTDIPGLGDATFTATVTGMSGPGVPASHTWRTTFFDPENAGVDQTIKGPSDPPAIGADYRSGPVPHASGYQLLVQPPPPDAANYVENGDAQLFAPLIVGSTTGTYPMLQGSASLVYSSGTSTFTPFSGTKSMHLCFPADASEPDGKPHNQSFRLGPEFIPSANSTVSFQELFRWLFTANRVSLEISTDGGAQWAELYGRNGATVYDPKKTIYPSNWDRTWNLRSVSLKDYAGKLVQLRFILRHNYFSFEGADIDHGCYIDDITLTDVRRLAAGVTTDFTGEVMRLGGASAGQPLVVGASYWLRARPKVGLGYLGYSPVFPVTVSAKVPTGFEAANPGLAAQPLGDADGDGISNFLEYAFGMSPLNPNAPASLPQAEIDSSNLTLSFPVPSGVTDVIYTGECSTNLSTWLPVTNTGTRSRPAFSIPLVPGRQCYIRLKVQQAGGAVQQAAAAVK